MPFDLNSARKVNDIAAPAAGFDPSTARKIDEIEAEPIVPDITAHGEDPTWEDFGRALARGATAIGEGVAWTAQRTPGARLLGDYSPERWLGKQLQAVAQSAGQTWGEGFSPVAKKAQETAFLGPGTLTDKWNRAKLGAAESIPGTMLGMGVGGKVAQGLQAAGMGTKAATMVGYGLGEAGVAAPSAGAGTEAEVLAMPVDQLRASPEYQAAWEGLKDEPLMQRDAHAREIVAKAAGGDAAAMTFLSTFALSAPFGSVLGRAMGKVGGPGRAANVGRSATEEAVQEFGQSGSEELAKNIAIQQNADPTRGLGDDVLEAAVGGALTGPIIGGPAALAAPVEKAKAPKTVEELRTAAEYGLRASRAGGRGHHAAKFLRHADAARADAR